MGSYRTGYLQVTPGLDYNQQRTSGSQRFITAATAPPTWLIMGSPEQITTNCTYLPSYQSTVHNTICCNFESIESLHTPNKTPTQKLLHHIAVYDLLQLHLWRWSPEWWIKDEWVWTWWRGVLTQALLAWPPFIKIVYKFAFSLNIILSIVRQACWESSEFGAILLWLFINLYYFKFSLGCKLFAFSYSNVNVHCTVFYFKINQWVISLLVTYIPCK